MDFLSKINKALDKVNPMKAVTSIGADLTEKTANSV